MSEKSKTQTAEPKKKPKNTKLIVSSILGVLGVILLAVSLYLIYYSYQQIGKSDTAANNAALAAFGLGIAGGLFTIIAWILNAVFSPAVIVFGIITFVLLALSIYLMFLAHQKIESNSTTSANASALSAFIIGIIAGVGVIITWILLFVYNAGKTYVESQEGAYGEPVGRPTDILLKTLAA